MINTTHTHTLTMIIIQYTYYLVTTRVSRKFQIMMNRFYTTNSDGKKNDCCSKIGTKLLVDRTAGRTCPQSK